MPDNAAKERAVQLLYDHIIALPHPEYGVINMLPFSHDSEQVRQVRRHVCEAIVELFDGVGFLVTDVPDTTPMPVHEVNVLCQEKGDLILGLMTDENGTAIVNAQKFIQTVANTNPECPHGPMTLALHAEHMQRELQREAEEADAAAEQAMGDALAGEDDA